MGVSRASKNIAIYGQASGPKPSQTTTKMGNYISGVTHKQEWVKTALAKDKAKYLNSPGGLAVETVKGTVKTLKKFGSIALKAAIGVSTRKTLSYKK